jgi:hypothetical protein
MKTLILFILFSMITVYYHADCVPFAVNTRGDDLTGCPNLYKQTNLLVTFPADGYSEHRTPAGFGQCEQSSACNALENYIEVRRGPTQCWPQFYEPVRREGYWSQEVQDMQAKLELRYCGEPSFGYAGKVNCRPFGPSRFTTVVHSCPPAGGIGGWPGWYYPFCSDGTVWDGFLGVCVPWVVNK